MTKPTKKQLDLLVSISDAEWKKRNTCLGCSGSGRTKDEKCLTCDGTGIKVRPTPEEIRKEVARIKEERTPKYPAGKCVVCKGVAEPVMRSRGELRLGGPPLLQYVAHYCCKGCGLLYGRRPGE